MKVLLLGGHGLLGSALRVTAPEGSDVAAPRRLQVDVTDRDALSRAVDAAEPSWIVHCAAFTGVDLAEEAPSEALRVNADSVRTVAALAAARGAAVLLPSTDYVFDGNRSTPWNEDDAPSSRSAYARSKRAGEEALLDSGAAGVVVRTSWLFGRAGRNFPRTMWDRARARTASSVVDDQRGAPTFADDLARWCWHLIGAGASGIYHATNAGSATWLDIAQRIYARAGWADGVTSTTSAALNAPAKRPAYSVLGCARLDALLDAPRRPWDVALDEYLGILESAEAA
jgi:dTDP-4-dehydrorhamnose reductase